MLSRFLIFLFTLLLLFNSCATLKNDYYQNFYLHTKDYDKVQVVDTTYTLPAMIPLKRSPKDIVATFSSERDTLKPDLRVLFKGRLGPEFWIGNIYLSAPLSYLIDLTNPKRFQYNRGMVLDVSNNAVEKFYNEPIDEDILENWAQTIHLKDKGETRREFFLLDRSNKLYIMWEFPLLNAFSFKPNGYEDKVSQGFLGFGLGVEYYYKSNAYWSAGATIATDFPVPFPVPISSEGDHNVLTTSFISVLHGHRLSRLHLAYGLQFSHNSWSYHDDGYIGDDGKYERELKPEVHTKNNKLGLALVSKLALSRKVDLKLQYNPSLYSLNRGKPWSFESFLSLGVEFRIMIKR